MSKSHVCRVRELYKLILRVHRSLPDDLKILGDNYAREEFKRHKKCKPQEAQIFLNEWREYAVSMSRQALPARAERRLPADEQQARPSRRLRAADPGQAAEGREVRAVDPGQAAGGEEVKTAHQEQAVGGREVRAADQWMAAGGMEVRAVNPGQAVGGREIRAADQEQAVGGVEVRAADQGQAHGGREVRAVDLGQAAGGGEVRAADPGQAVGGREVRAADLGQAAGGGVVRAAEQAGAHPRFGIDLDLDRVRQLAPEQLLNLFNLLMAARGENPNQYEDPIDIGIGLIDSDLFANLSENAKQQILKVEKEDLRRYLRGEIPEDNIYYSKNFWFELLQDAQTVIDLQEFSNATMDSRIARNEAQNAKICANKAEVISTKTKNEADRAVAIAKYAKNLVAALEADEKKDSFQNTVTELENNAMNKVNKAKAMSEETDKLAMEAKSKELEAQAAYDFSAELRNDLKKDLKKYE